MTALAARPSRTRNDTVIHRLCAASTLPRMVAPPRHEPLLNVAVVTETFPPEVNGVAMTLGRMVDGLLGLGHRVHLVRPRQGPGDRPATRDRYAELLVAGLPIPRYPGLRLGLPAGRMLEAQWRKTRPDVIQVVTEGPLGASALTAARRLAIPVVSEFHTNFPAYSRLYGFGWLEALVTSHLRRMHNRGQLTLVPTRSLAEELARKGYRNLRVVSRGIDTGLFNPHRRSAALRAQWGVADDAPVLAYVGRLAAEKNLPLVLECHERIAAELPSARLVLVGDGPLRASLARRHPQHIYAGMRRGEDLSAHYASADLFLFPSVTETFGNVTAEALASGLPVVAYRCAAAAELICDGRNGAAVAPGDATAFVRSALELLRDRKALRRMRTDAAASVAHLHWDAVNRALVDALREAIAAALGDPAQDAVTAP